MKVSALKAGFVAIALMIIFDLRAVSPEHGSDALRELVVFPTIEFNFSIDWGFNGIICWVSDGTSVPRQMEKLRLEITNGNGSMPNVMRLAYLLEQNGQTNLASEILDNIENQCREKIANRPQDGSLQVDLAMLLSSESKLVEAESTFRKAQVLSSNDWRAWAGLAELLERQALSALLPPNASLTISRSPSQEILDFKPGTDALKTAESRWKESKECAARATVLGVNVADAHVASAGFLMGSNLMAWRMSYLRNPAPVNPAEWTPRFISKDMANQFEQAADLAPEDAKLTAAACFMGFMRGALESNPGNLNLDPEAGFDASYAYRHKAMNRLEALAEKSNKATGAEALQDLAILRFMMKEPSEKLAETAHRAVMLDPTREQAWDLWFVFSKTLAPMDELVSMCKSRIQQDDSARNHCLLAKLYVKTKDWPLAVSEIQTAFKKDPKSITSVELAFAVGLRLSTDSETLSACVGFGNSVKEVLSGMPEGTAHDEALRVFLLDEAIGCELEGTGETKKAANELVNKVLARFPDDGEALKIRDALE